jgi:hypothetical protein
MLLAQEGSKSLEIHWNASKKHFKHFKRKLREMMFSWWLIWKPQREITGEATEVEFSVHSLDTCINLIFPSTPCQGTQCNPENSVVYLGMYLQFPGTFRQLPKNKESHGDTLSRLLISAALLSIKYSSLSLEQEVRPMTTGTAYQPIVELELSVDQFHLQAEMSNAPPKRVLVLHGCVVSSYHILVQVLELAWALHCSFTQNSRTFKDKVSICSSDPHTIIIQRYTHDIDWTILSRMRQERHWAW